MLRIVNNKTVESNSGYSVIAIDIHHVKYTEYGRSAIIEIEGGISSSGEIDWLIYSDSLSKWEPPHNTETISVSKHNEILDRISECLSLLDMQNRIA